jgi:DNA-3-methyladenine glycosylase I
MIGVGVDPTAPLTVVFDDGVPRCAWVAKAVAGIVEYHDLTWGTPTHDESALLGALAEAILEGGLSWATVFRKRTTLHAAFHHFDPEAVAAITDADINLLLTNPGIIRNRRKIEAIVHDAQVMCTGPSLAELAWSYLPADRRPVASWAEGLRGSQEARALSTRLNELGYRGVGPTVAHSFLGAIGAINGHVEGCFRASSPGGATPPL